MRDFAAPETTGEFPHEEAESIAMMKFLESIVPTEPEARRTLMGVATLALPLSAFMSEKWTALKTAQSAAGVKQ